MRDELFLDHCDVWEQVKIGHFCSCLLESYLWLQRETLQLPCFSSSGLLDPSLIESQSRWWSWLHFRSHLRAKSRSSIAIVQSIEHFHATDSFSLQVFGETDACGFLLWVTFLSSYNINLPVFAFAVGVRVLFEKGRRGCAFWNESCGEAAIGDFFVLADG